MNQRLRKQIEDRDQHCWHCGATDELVLHHRKNRQMGGSKNLDRADNLIRVCAAYNFAMEAQPVIAERAREFGHKLESWREFSDAVFDMAEGRWYFLTQDGRKDYTNPPAYLI